MRQTSGAAGQTNALGRSIPTNGVSLGADHVDLLIDGGSQGRATYPDWADNVGAWNKTLTLGAGVHTLTANAVHPSGHFTATANATFTVNVPVVTVTSAYDADGNVTSRTFSNGVVQTLTWDAFNRLIKVSSRDASNNGYDWSAVYDGLGRRLRTTEQTVAANVLTGTPLTVTSHYDPQVEFLELGIEIAGQRVWKTAGPDLNGVYGGLNGTGGVEAVFREPAPTDNQANAWAMQTALTDTFGNIAGTANGNTVTWSATRVGGSGPLPGSPVQRVGSLDDVLTASAWRTRRFDITGFAWLGARYYEPTSGRLLSPDPLGHGSDMSLYAFASGDGVNGFDADGRLTTQFGQNAWDGWKQYVDFGNRNLVQPLNTLFDGVLNGAGWVGGQVLGPPAEQGFHNIAFAASFLLGPGDVKLLYQSSLSYVKVATSELQTIKIVGSGDGSLMNFADQTGALFPQSETTVFTYHGSPVKSDVIFEEGLVPNGTSTDLLAHARNSRTPPSAFVSTSTSADVAAWKSEPRRANQSTAKTGVPKEQINAWNSFSATNASENEANLAYIRLNTSTASPPRAACPALTRLLHPQPLSSASTR